MAEAAEGEFDLRSLDDAELIEQVHDDMYNGLKAEVEEATHIFLERGWGPDKVLNDALVEGMRIVGIDFRDGILFVPEVLLAANAMKGGMAILRPLLAETGAEPIGKIVIGTVKGDIHDIGKNLVGMMMEGAGFEVIDLGINNPVEKYLAALEEHKPDFLGMSALLTTTMPYMKVVIDTLKDKNLRDKYIVLVGGAPLNEEFGKAIGADAYCRDAAIAVETAKRLLAERRAAGRTDGHACVPARKLVIACGALAREIAALREANGWSTLDVACLPPELHNRPERIARRRAREDPRAPQGLRRDLRRLWRLRHARRARRGARRGGRRAHRRGALLRVLRDARGLRGARRGGARQLLPDGFPAAAFRAPRDRCARHRPPPGAAARLLRQLPPARLPGPGAEARCRGRRARGRGAPRARTRRPADRLRRPRLEPRGLRRPAVDARMASLTVISWRDIPAQVIVRRGRETAKAKLSDRFQEAVDRAAMRAGKGSSDLYLAEWKRSAATPCSDDIEQEAAAEASRIEARYSDEDLERLVRAKGLAEAPA